MVLDNHMEGGEKASLLPPQKQKQNPKLIIQSKQS